VLWDNPPNGHAASAERTVFGVTELHTNHQSKRRKVRRQAQTLVAPSY
jgi:hypothetical protein